MTHETLAVVDARSRLAARHNDAHQVERAMRHHSNGLSLVGSSWYVAPPTKLRRHC